MSADGWGIADGYTDIFGGWHDASPTTRARIRAAMGAEHAAGPAPAPVAVIHPGEAWSAPSHGTLGTETGAVLTMQPGDFLPAGLGYGEHVFHGEHGGSIDIICAPSAAYLPERLHAWGWAVQLYAMRSRRSWGCGDLADLRDLARWSATQHGASMLLVNPLHANAPVAHQQPSPYFPTSRCFRNPLYIAIEDVPGAVGLSWQLDAAVSAAQALNKSPRIDRDRVFRLKMDALEMLWARFRISAPPADRESFAAYRRNGGTTLEQFTTFCALSEIQPGPWRAWPAEWQRPDTAAVANIAADRNDRLQFFAWLQWLLERQLSAVGQHLDVMTDLAIGVDRDGADAWMWQDTFALDMAIGAPPDTFNTQGQNWGLPPFDPHRLAQSRYAPFRAMVRSAFRHAKGVRIDHVMGLFRLWWIPEGAAPTDGCYVYTPFRDLTGILALESWRNGTYVVGEDLGTIETYVRNELHQRRFLSTKLLQFEDTPAAEMPTDALTAFTTHDLPTVAGLWTGSDLVAQRAIGLEPNEAGTQHTRQLIARRADATDDAPLHDVIVGVHAELAQAPSAIITATLDDALAVEERPNMPGTVDEWPNWRIALPLPLEDIMQHPLVNRVAETIRDGRAATGI